jgi:hypothetical protein
MLSGLKTLAVMLVIALVLGVLTAIADFIKNQPSLMLAIVSVTSFTAYKMSKSIKRR